MVPKIGCFIAIIFNEYVFKIKYLGTTVTNQNRIDKEIKTRLNSGNDHCHSDQSLLSYCFISNNLKIKIYKGLILCLVLYGCETWSLI
jgi:hypothetical protein